MIRWGKCCSKVISPSNSITTIQSASSQPIFQQPCGCNMSRKPTQKLKGTQLSSSLSASCVTLHHRSKNNCVRGYEVGLLIRRDAVFRRIFDDTACKNIDRLTHKIIYVIFLVTVLLSKGNINVIIITIKRVVLGMIMDVIIIGIVIILNSYS